MNWRMGNLEKAETYLNEVLSGPEKDQDAKFHAECLNGLALLKTSQDRMEEAIDAYHQAVRLAPDQIFVWSNLGNLYLRLGKDSEALKAYQKAVQVKPSDPIAWNG
jgi:tetratricopeptide (TPR) repeat protein